MRLTVCVEQVAASGGYMMACTADEILASPFAVLGSIGVITEQPNVYERLKKEGVVFSTVTAGKFKRTLTYAHAAGSNHLATVGSHNLGMYGGACTDLPSVLGPSLSRAWAGRRRRSTRSMRRS